MRNDVALRSEILANLARRRFVSPESMKQLEACLARVKWCAERRNDMIDYGYGIARNGLVIAPNRDECGEIMPVTGEQLRQLAHDMSDCTAELDRFASTLLQDEELGQYSPIEDSGVLEPVR